MRLVCPNCVAQYEVADDTIPATGRDVQCANCNHIWFQDAAFKLSTDDLAYVPARRASQAFVQPGNQEAGEQGTAGDPRPEPATVFHSQRAPHQAEPETAPERTLPPVDQNVLDILRSEAAFSSRRRAEAKPAESNPTEPKPAESKPADPPAQSGAAGSPTSYLRKQPAPEPPKLRKDPHWAAGGGPDAPRWGRQDPELMPDPSPAPSSDAPRRDKPTDPDELRAQIRAGVSSLGLRDIEEETPSEPEPPAAPEDTAREADAEDLSSDSLEAEVAAPEEADSAPDTSPEPDHAPRLAEQPLVGGWRRPVRQLRVPEEPPEEDAHADAAADAAIEPPEAEAQEPAPEPDALQADAPADDTEDDLQAVDAAVETASESPMEDPVGDAPQADLPPEPDEDAEPEQDAVPESEPDPAPPPLPKATSEPVRGEPRSFGLRMRALTVDTVADEDEAAATTARTAAFEIPPAPADSPEAEPVTDAAGPEAPAAAERSSGALAATEAAKTAEPEAAPGATVKDPDPETDADAGPAETDAPAPDDGPDATSAKEPGTEAEAERPEHRQPRKFPIGDRKGLLPDVDELNTSLRMDTPEGDSGLRNAAFSEEDAANRGRFWLGLVTALMLFGIFWALYLMGPAISDSFPALAGYVVSFRGVVDHALDAVAQAWVPVADWLESLK